MDSFSSQDDYKQCDFVLVKSEIAVVHHTPITFFFYVRELLGSKTRRKDQMYFLPSRTYVDNLSRCQANQSSVSFVMNHKENLRGTWTPNNFSKASYVQYHKFLTFRWMKFQEAYTAGMEKLHVTLHCCRCFMLWVPEIWHSLIG